MLRDKRFDLPGVSRTSSGLVLLSALRNETVLAEINRCKLVSLAYQALLSHSSLNASFALLATVVSVDAGLVEPTMLMLISAIKAEIMDFASLKTKIQEWSRIFWSEITYDYDDGTDRQIANWNSENKPGKLEQELYFSLAAMVVILSAFPSISKADLLECLSLLRLNGGTLSLNTNIKETTKFILYLLFCVRGAAQISTAVVQGCRQYVDESGGKQDKKSLTYLVSLFLEKYTRDPAFDRSDFIKQVGSCPVQYLGAVETLLLFTRTDRLSREGLLDNLSTNKPKCKQTTAFTGFLMGLSAQLRTVYTHENVNKDPQIMHILIVVSILHQTCLTSVEQVSISCVESCYFPAF